MDVVANILQEMKMREATALMDQQSEGDAKYRQLCTQRGSLRTNEQCSNALFVDDDYNVYIYI